MGEKLAYLAVEQAERFVTIVDITTTKAIVIEVPTTLLLRAFSGDIVAKVYLFHPSQIFRVGRPSLAAAELSKKLQRDWPPASL